MIPVVADLGILRGHAPDRPHTGFRQFEQRVVRKQQPTRLEHRADVRECEHLLQHVVIDEHVGGHDEVELVRGGSLQDDVQIERFDTERDGWPHRHGAHVHVGAGKRGAAGGRRATDSIAGDFPIPDRRRLPFHIAVERQP